MGTIPISEQLKKIVRDHGGKAAPVAKKVGMDRSYFMKLMNGDHEASEKTVDRIKKEFPDAFNESGEDFTANGDDKLPLSGEVLYYIEASVLKYIAANPGDRSIIMKPNADGIGEVEIKWSEIKFR